MSTKYSITGFSHTSGRGDTGVPEEWLSAAEIVNAIGKDDLCLGEYIPTVSAIEDCDDGGVLYIGDGWHVRIGKKG